MSSQKYDISPMAFKYDIAPRQFKPTLPPTQSYLPTRPSSTPPSTTLPSSYSTATSNTLFTKSPPFIPMATTTEEPPATTTTTFHRVPSSDPRPSTDSDADSLSTNARLIRPTSHHTAQPDYTHTYTIYPTTLFRLVALILLIVSVALYASKGAHRAVPAILFISLAFLRILIGFIYHTSRAARWRGGRGVNLAVDFALVAGLAGSIGGAFAVDLSYWGHTNIAASILGWVACLFLGLAAVDTGRPSRIAITTRLNFDVTTSLSLDFRTRRGVLSLDGWDSERPEMGRSASRLV
ncbi:hypothetical protein VE01_02850 [Pseudogymnoascus verrucosus]|uniref:MARVEL domain-containing protein n=1 Tax=Pseudogymnoascus verrucosus TaxID=342668 RepID=A0A1B8GUW0_9PEZI|nr:uncharacterized protein VE01_02850 [Pseudogymnoascus verrucosus]OBT99609.1 hypothetical protein VE01_02850 [Pseudogymnoascus verrucosus]